MAAVAQLPRLVGEDPGSRSIEGRAVHLRSDANNLSAAQLDALGGCLQPCPEQVCIPALCLWAAHPLMLYSPPQPPWHAT